MFDQKKGLRFGEKTSDFGAQTTIINFPWSGPQSHVTSRATTVVQTNILPQKLPDLDRNRDLNSLLVFLRS